MHLHPRRRGSRPLWPELRSIIASRLGPPLSWIKEGMSPASAGRILAQTFIVNNDSFPEKSTFSHDFNTSGGPPDISPQPPERSTEKNPTRPADLPTHKPLFRPGETYETMADRLIREAQERGEFDHLRGSGKPLNLGQSNP